MVAVDSVLMICMRWFADRECVEIVLFSDSENADYDVCWLSLLMAVLHGIWVLIMVFTDSESVDQALAESKSVNHGVCLLLECW